MAQSIYIGDAPRTVVQNKQVRQCLDNSYRDSTFTYLRYFGYMLACIVFVKYNICSLSRGPSSRVEMSLSSLGTEVVTVCAY